MSNNGDKEEQGRKSFHDRRNDTATVEASATTIEGLFPAAKGAAAVLLGEDPAHLYVISHNTPRVVHYKRFVEPREPDLWQSMVTVGVIPESAREKKADEKPVAPVVSIVKGRTARKPAARKTTTRKRAPSKRGGEKKDGQ